MKSNLETNDLNNRTYIKQEHPVDVLEAVKTILYGNTSKSEDDKSELKKCAKHQIA